MNSTDPSNPISSLQFSSGLAALIDSVNPLSWTHTETRTATGTGTKALTGAVTGAGAWGSNALVAILQRIPPGDLEALQRGVEVASSSFRYYQYNLSLRLNDRDIPTR